MQIRRGRRPYRCSGVEATDLHRRYHDAGFERRGVLIKDPSSLEASCRDLIPLKFTSMYPATPANNNVRTIPHLRELFGCEVGLSDHSMGVGVSVAAVGWGDVVEKHFALDCATDCLDTSFSLERA